ncbi:MAG TPA: signal peptidase II [Candidatus Dormibacteraeota bacterium]
MTPGRIAFAVIAVAVFIVDRVTKGLVNANIDPGREVAAIPGLVWITNTRNSGAAFGFAPAGGTLFLAASAVVAVALVVYVAQHPGRTWTDALLGLILGGTLGNGYDRLFHGSVTDFVALHWWPVFNVADSAISVGVVLLLAGQLFRRRGS